MRERDDLKRSRLRTALAVATATLALALVFGAPAAWGGAGFESEEFPVTLSGSSEEVVFGFGGLKVTCAKASLTASMSEAIENTESISTTESSFTECTGFEMSVTVNTSGCAFVLGVGEETESEVLSGSVGIACEGEGEEEATITFTIGTCEIQIGSQSSLTEFDYDNELEASPRHFQATANVAEMTYTVGEKGFICALLGAGTKENGTITGTIAFSGAGEEGETGVFVDEPTRLCKVNEFPCDEEKENVYPSGTLLQAASTNDVFKVNGLVGKENFSLEIICSSGHMTGSTNDKTGHPRLPAEVESWSFLTCIPEGEMEKPCNLSSQGTPYQTLFRYFPVVQGLGVHQIKLRFLCTESAKKFNCDYGGTVVFLVNGGAEATFERGAFPPLFRLKKEGEENCPEEMSWTAKYTVKKPAPLFLTS